MAVDNKFYIPGKIIAGFSTNEKLSAKLAHITYKDARGRIVREKNWQNVIEDPENPRKIFVGYEKDVNGRVIHSKPIHRHTTGYPILEIDNTPTKGFILNKPNNQNKINWNTKPNGCYMLDPRGFEFNLSINNLMYILQLTSGDYTNTEFVYSWVDEEVILLPCTSEEYISSRVFTDVKSMKFSLKDLTIGHTYLTRDLEKAIYIGRYDLIETDKMIDKYSYPFRRISLSKGHVFLMESEKKRRFIALTSTNIAKLHSNVVVPNLQELITELEGSGTVLTIDNVIITPVTVADILQKERDIPSSKIKNYVNHSYRNGNSREHFIGYVSVPKENGFYEPKKLYQVRNYRGYANGINIKFTVEGYILKPSYQEYEIKNNNFAIKNSKTLTELKQIEQNERRIFGRNNIPIQAPIAERDINALGLVKIKLKFKNSDKLKVV